MQGSGSARLAIFCSRGPGAPRSKEFGSAPFLRPGVPPASALAQIGDRNSEPFDEVVLIPNLAGFGGDQDANARLRSAGFPKLVLDQHHGLGLAVDVDGNAFLAAAVDDPVSLEAVPVRREGLVAAAEMNARFATPADVILPNQIV